MRHVVEPATVTRVGPIFTDPSGKPVQGIELQFIACPDVTWSIYLGKAHPQAITPSPSMVSCLEKLKVGEKVDVAIDVKPISGKGANGGSATQIGKCVLRPKETDSYEGLLGAGTAPSKTCKWAREE
jgi:hypothetical protein